MSGEPHARRGSKAGEAHHGARPADAPWRPPAASRATRSVRRPSRGSGRSLMVGPDRRLRACESFLEKGNFSIVLARPDVRDLREQPAAITYVDDAGVERRHTFDAIVDFHDGARNALFVKSADKAASPQIERLVALLAAHLPKAVADGLVVLTEDDVDPDVLHDVRLINNARLHPEPGHDDVLRRHLAGLAGEATIAELARGSGLAGFCMRAVARLLHDGTLVKATPGRIASSTAVRLAPGKAGA